MSNAVEMNSDHGDVDRLLRTAGPRPRPPAEMEDEVRAAIHAEWLRVVAARRRRRFRQVAIAAGLGAVALAVWLLNQAPPQTVVVASIERTIGGGTVHTAQSKVAPFTVQQELHAGDILSTGAAGSVSIRMQDVSVRLDRDSSVQLTSVEELRITSGALYVDSGLGQDVPSLLLVRTPAGVVEHLGTQYEVRLLDSGTRIRVREGRIQFSAPRGGRIVGEAGTQLTILADGEVHSESVARSGDDWAWVGRVVPSFAIDNRPLPEFLRWAGHELGQEVVFATPASQAEAASIRLRGSIEGLTPDAALAAVLSTTRLSSTQKNGQIVIELPTT